MDIFEISAEQREIPIAIPGTSEVMHVTLRPPTDPMVRQAQRRFRDRTAREGKGWTVEQEISAIADFASTFVAGWRFPDGWQHHDCTPDTVRALLRKQEWLARDIMQAAADSDAFFAPRATG
jgi:hypothetical protein